MSPTIPDTTSHHPTTLLHSYILGLGELLVTRSLPFHDFLCTGFVFLKWAEIIIFTEMLSLVWWSILRVSVRFDSPLYIFCY